MTKVAVRVLRDRQFYACLMLGPLTWLLLASFIPLREQWAGLFNPGFQLILLVGVYPVLEEVVFRGLILGWLTSWTKQRRYGVLSLANLLTSGLFVLAHLVYQPWLWALLVFFPSLIFGYMKERHHSLWPPIFLHGFYNLGFILLFA
ncbi:hypothetical protein MNBD_GAMMA21-2486 [hydrothermal vent metagenome]|uniref:CAAX prenyl protease 2/Lysostaphin resistance protein A-like domain-containing protein n=1 Tax=hydrothermal vent metagenome TaxID=652676 RepID=A0A3B1A848_9ZZZZ